MFAALYKKMGSNTFGIAKGANHRLLNVIDFMKRNPDAEFLGFEQSVKVTFNGIDYGRRDYDAVFRLNGKIVNIEAKAWSRGYPKEGLRRALSSSGKIHKDGTDPSGHLIRDFAECVLMSKVMHHSAGVNTGNFKPRKVKLSYSDYEGDKELVQEKMEVFKKRFEHMVKEPQLAAITVPPVEVELELL